MNYVERLRNKAREHSSIVCMGMDPLLDKIPLKGSPAEVIEEFYTRILESIEREGTKPAVVKPNIAFYEQYGFEGLHALKRLIAKYHSAGIPVLLDAKRGDIGKTSEAYAKAVFDFWAADAVTVAPYMGSDSVGPFISWGEKGKGVYVLLRTSNKGAVDIQDIKSDGKKIYQKTAEKMLEWHKPGLGAVVGATYLDELRELSSFFVNSGKEVPFLIPGGGAQGGSAAEVAEALRSTGNDILIHRINSSSEINYAYLKEGTDDFAGAAVRAIKKLNAEIGPLS